MAATSSAAALGAGIHNIAFRSSHHNNAGQAVVIGFFVFTMGNILQTYRF